MGCAISDSLDRWLQFGNEKHLPLLSKASEDLTKLHTGPVIDQKAKLQEKQLLKVKLSAKGGTPGRTAMQNVVTCEGYIVDVPPDGNCGFHALSRAAFVYGGLTFLRTPMPNSSRETRSLLIQFIRKYRREIEDVVVNSFDIELARLYLWNDVHGTARRGSQISHEELCSSLENEGLSGHWLGAGVGEAEIHLLGRALGVTVHCVMAATEAGGAYCLRQTIAPYKHLWQGALSGTPKGAVVIRFVGEYNYGHYQIVRSGRWPSTATNATKIDIYSAPPKRSRKTSRKRRREVDEYELERDLRAVDFMHGVQPQTKLRYLTDYKIVDNAFAKLKSKGKDPLDLERNGYYVVKTIQSLLLRRCGPREKGYENLSAKATGNVVLATVASWYKDHGRSFTDGHTTVMTGRSVHGPPWKAQKVLEFKRSLLKMQAKSRTVLERKAYQLTHDDVAAAMRYCVASQLGCALDTSFHAGTNPSVDWLQLQIALMVVAAFGSGCRGAEITSILLGDLRFLHEGADTTIGVILYGVKSKDGYSAVRRIVFPSWSDTCVISPAFAVLTQIALVHGTTLSDTDPEAPLFPNIQRNQVLRGQRMPSDTYNASIKSLFMTLGISDNVTEHSPRRGGSGFRYYVLNEKPDYIRDILGHSNTTEALNYIGFFDRESSYVIQGYGTCGSKKIR